MAVPKNKHTQQTAWHLLSLEPVTVQGTLSISINPGCISPTKASLGRGRSRGIPDAMRYVVWSVWLCCCQPYVVVPTTHTQQTAWHLLSFEPDTVQGTRSISIKAACISPTQVFRSPSLGRERSRGIPDAMWYVVWSVWLCLVSGGGRENCSHSFCLWADCFCTAVQTRLPIGSV